MEKTYIAKNILEKMKKYNNTNLLISSDKKEFEINFLQQSVPHLLGLQYMSIVKIKGREIINEVIDNNLSDQDILEKVKENYGIEQQNKVKERIETFEYFMNNLENALIVEKTLPSKMNVNYLMIQTNNNKFHHLGILSGDNGALLESYDELSKNEKDYLVTYFLENNKDYYNKSKIFEPIKRISYYNEELVKYMPFSFDEDKQKKLNEVEKLISNYDYHKAITLPIDEIKNEINDNKKIKTKSKSKQKGMER